jgi:copper resistance protein C
MHLQATMRNPTLPALVLLFSTWPVTAHAILVDAIPIARQVVSGRSVPVKLRFNSRIDGKRSTLALMGPDGHERPLPIFEQRSPDTLTANAGSLTPGSYILRWQVLAEDGHITRGQVSFTAQ